MLSLSLSLFFSLSLPPFLPNSLFQKGISSNQQALLRYNSSSLSMSLSSATKGLFGTSM
eukprot:m.246578 g.246578  ORF g.246578 m.246578 type:complete len:59 (-) comp33848_c3_seq4:3265-3441(-)